MNLDNLKPAWQQFRLSNSLQSLDTEEILLIIERVENRSIKIHKYLINSIMFATLIIFCQGG
jgi:hypothetical protein